MGTKADRDLWGQALAIESRYGDRGLEVIARKVDELSRAGQYSDAEFWSEVATCLTELHEIRWPGGKSARGPAQNAEREAEQTRMAHRAPGSAGAAEGLR